MRAADAWAIEDRGIPSLELMETAGGAVADAAAELAGDGVVRIVCGKGNNAGDGLVAARLLGQRGYRVEVLLLWPADELSPDSTANLERLGSGPVEVTELGEDDIADSLDGSAIVVDAIFGTGFCRRPAGAGRRRDRRRSTIRLRRSSPATSPPGVDAGDRRADGAASTPRSPSPFTRQARSPDRARHMAATGELSRRRHRHSRRGAGSGRRRRTIGSGSLGAAAPPRRPVDQVRLRQRRSSSVARAG